MFRNHDYQVNDKLKDIPSKCSIKDQHFKITNQLWNSLMQKLCQEYQESDLKVSVDLIDENGKSCHEIVKLMLYAKAKEQHLAGHGYDFGFYKKENCLTLICFHELDYDGLPIDLEFVR